MAIDEVNLALARATEGAEKITAPISIDQVFTSAIFFVISLFLLILAQLLPGVIGPTLGTLLVVGIVLLGYRYLFPGHARETLLSGASTLPLLSARVLFLCALPVLLVALTFALWPGIRYAHVSGAPKGFAVLAITTGLLCWVILEEVMFRGVLLPYLTQKHALHKAVLVQAVLFCFAHYLSARADLPLFKAPFYLALGIFLGYLVTFTKSLWPAVLAHGLWNASASLEIWFTPLIMRNGAIHPVEAGSYVWVSLLALGLATGGVLLLLRSKRSSEP